MKPISIIAAPSGLGLEAAGVEGLASRLLDLGLADALGAPSRPGSSRRPRPARSIRRQGS